MLSIKSNIASLNAQRNLSGSSGQLESSMSKLSSGFRITRAGDDAAGLGISSNLEAQIRSYNQATRNAGDAQSLIQTAESSLNETTNILSRLRELAMQSSSDGVGDSERVYIQSEADALAAEIDRIAQATEYNGTKLLLGAGPATLTFQVGIRNTADDRITVSTVDSTVTTLLGAATLDMDDSAAAQSALGVIDDAIALVSGSRAELGATGNRLQSVIANNQMASESLSAANSRIRDVDVAEETSRLARAQIMMQAGVSVLAQANQQPQLALKLLG